MTQKEVMLSWFHEQYEDAAHSLFYDGREGGYQYELGNEPCDPLEVLQEQFPSANPKVVQEVAANLSDGTPWVKKQ